MTGAEPTAEHRSPGWVRLLAGGVAVVLVGTFVVAYMATVRSRGLDPGELTERVASSRPSWEGYQEDIKGQVGAAAVAQWSGQPREAWREDGELRVRFALVGLWGERDIAMPILVREPLGAVLRDTGVIRDRRLITYRFTLPEAAAGGAVPWIDVKYPHGERRMKVEATPPVDPVLPRMPGMPRR